MKKAIKTLVILGALVLIYFLFAPIFSYLPIGTDLSELNDLHPKAIHTQPVKAQADDILKREFKSLDAPSLSVAIGMNNSLGWSNAIGYSSVADQVLANTHTQYRIGSVSKSLTSLGLGILIENESLSPNTRVQDHLTFVSNDLSQLTVQQLASHTSGIRNYGPCWCFPIWEFFDNDQYSSIEEGISIFNDDELLFEPGADFSYSTYNYTMLSGVMEGAARQNFLSFMQNEVFSPLGLYQTTPNYLDDETDNVAEFYEVNAGKVAPAFKTNSSNKWAGGGFRSTPSDLVRFGNAVLHYKLVDSLTTSLLFKPVALKNGEVNEQNYGMGWRNDVSTKIIKDNREVRIIHHGGTAQGSTALLILLPEYDVTVAVAMNRSSRSFDLFNVAYQIAEIFILDRE